MATTPRRFRKVRLNEISLVDMGADPNAVVTIFKRSPKEGMMPEDKEDAATVAAQTILELRKKLDAAEAELSKRQPVPDSVAAELAELRKANDKWRTEFAAIAEEREIAKAIDMVKVEYPHLPIKAEEFGPVMKRAMATLSADDVAVLKRLFKAADGAMVSLAKQAGRNFGQTVEGSAEAELEKKANAIMASDGVSFAKAYDIAMQRNPELYSRYLTERGEAN